MTIAAIKKLLKEFKDEPTGNEFLDNRYDPNSKYYRFFYQFNKLFKPKVVVELGSWQGTSAAYFAGGNPDTLVITVDHHTDPGDAENEDKTLDAYWEFDNLRYCKGWTCNEIYEEEKDQHQLGTGENAYPKVIKELNGKKIDVLFIDSWHVYHQAVRDWNAYKPLLSKGAIVIVDDVLKGTPNSAIDGVEQFWDELKGTKHLDGDLHAGYPMGFLKV
jgi:predicted O-methyltransferase YrrM